MITKCGQTKLAWCAINKLTWLCKNYVQNHIQLSHLHLKNKVKEKYQLNDQMSIISHVIISETETRG